MFVVYFGHFFISMFLISVIIRVLKLGWNFQRLRTIKMSFHHRWRRRFLRLIFRLRGYLNLKRYFVLQWLFILIGRSVGLIGVVIVSSQLLTCVTIFTQTFMTYLCFDRVTSPIPLMSHTSVSEEEKLKRSARQGHHKRHPPINLFVYNMN